MNIFEKCEKAIQQYDFSNIIFGVLTLIICLIIELFFLPFKRTSLYKIFNPNKSTLTDLLVGSCYLFGIFSIIKAIVFVETNIFPVKFHINGLIESSLLQFFVYFLIVDFFNYWIHRIHHKIEFLWQIHKFHHSAVDFILITGNRIHPVERIVHKLIVFIPLRFMGVPVETYLTISILISFVDEMQHSMVSWNFGWIGRNIFFSPLAHRIHHSKEKEHWDKNFGDIFVFWDKIFGTYYYGQKINEEVGVTDNWYNKKGVIYDLFKSTWLSCKEFKDSLISGQWRAKHLR